MPWYSIGTFVRISPDEVSVADPEALQAIYSHSSGTIKSNLYAAFDAIPHAHSIFTVRSREEHARKRKILAHTMSPKTLAEFEPAIYRYERMLVRNWDEMCAAAAKGLSGIKGDCSWSAREGRAWFDCMPCKPGDIFCQLTHRTHYECQGTTTKRSISSVRSSVGRQDCSNNMMRSLHR